MVKISWLKINASGIKQKFIFQKSDIFPSGHHGYIDILVALTSTFPISAFHHYGCQIDFYPWKGVLITILYDSLALVFSARVFRFPQSIKPTVGIYSQTFI